MKRIALFGALALALMGAMPAANFNPAALTVGKPAVDLPAHAGKPLAIVAFASWCVGCIDELPRVLADYAKLKDRVDFLGVDYLDNPKAGEALVARFHIPFPVVISQPLANAPTPPPNDAAMAPDSMVLHGITAAMLPALAPKLTAHLPPTLAATLRDVAAFCAKHDAATCDEYAASKNVTLDTDREARADRLPTAPSPTPSAAPAGSGPISLPHLFIVDGSGVVRFDETGYDSANDTLLTDLAKLGISP